jgi:hypothetical protein
MRLAKDDGHGDGGGFGGSNGARPVLHSHSGGGGGGTGTRVLRLEGRGTVEHLGETGKGSQVLITV